MDGGRGRWNIIPIFTVDEVDDLVFFAMAYVEGESLGQRIRAHGPLAPAEAAKLLCDVARALAHAHARGVVHRDVKPDNILLEAAMGRTLVSDFGIVRVGAAPGTTDPRQLLGTAEFMSPEQACGDEVDARSDVYSLGVVGYYALAGRLPFEASDVYALLAALMARARTEHRTDPRAERRLRFWRGPVGRLLFKLAGWGRGATGERRQRPTFPAPTIAPPPRSARPESCRRRTGRACVPAPAG